MDCNWNAPGADPYTGSVAAAVAHYKYPPEVQRRLIERANALEFDDVLAIRREGVAGPHGESYDIRDMHFGKGRVCRNVLRSGWASDHVEYAMSYCEGAYCIVVPFVCKNVTRLIPIAAPPPPPAAPGGGPGGGAGGPTRFTALPVSQEPGAVSFAPFLPAPAVPYSWWAPIVVLPSPYVGGGGWYTLYPPAAPPPGITPSPPAIPEPSTWVLTTLGAIVLALRIWWRNRK